MILKPQDVVVALKLLSIGNRPWTYARMSDEIGISVSQLHAAVKRVTASKLASSLDSQLILNVSNFQEFLIHGLKYVFIPLHGEMTRGIPTGFASPILKEFFSITDQQTIPVWPHPEGTARGTTFSPLYKNVPHAAMQDAKLYDLLALVDAIRDGRARERETAQNLLVPRLNEYKAKIKY